MWFVCLSAQPCDRNQVGPALAFCINTLGVSLKALSHLGFRSLPVSSWQTNLQSEKHSKDTWTIKLVLETQSNYLFNDKKKHNMNPKKKTPLVHTQLEQQQQLEMLKINKIAFNKVKVTKVLVINGIFFVLSSLGWVALFLLREDFWLVFIWSFFFVFCFWFFIIWVALCFVEGRLFHLCSFRV